MLYFKSVNRNLFIFSKKMHFFAKKNSKPPPHTIRQPRFSFKTSHLARFRFAKKVGLSDSQNTVDFFADRFDCTGTVHTSE